MPCVPPLRSLAQLLDEGRTALNDPARRDRLRAEIQRAAGWKVEEMSEVEVSTWALVVLRPIPGTGKIVRNVSLSLKSCWEKSCGAGAPTKPIEKPCLARIRIDT